jgi:phosphomannomutase
MDIVLKDLLVKSSIKFGTSGARGLVQDFTSEVSSFFVQAFWQSCGYANTVVIGHDLRPSSPEITRACIAFFRGIGVEVIYVGALPTPAIAFYAQLKKCPAVVVTGSHIPFDRNGLKFYSLLGEISKIDEASILSQHLKMSSEIVLDDLPPANQIAHEAYVKRYLDFFSDRPLVGKTIAIYQHSSVARDILVEILEGLGAETIALGRTDDFTPVDTEAVTPHDMEIALEWAGEHKFDALITTDGDGDRPLIADENGCWLRGDNVGLLCAQALGADVVVTPVSCNTGVELCGDFLQVKRTKIGSPYVIKGIDLVAEEFPGHTVMGYEANGGFILGATLHSELCKLETLKTRDAVLPIIVILKESQRRATKVSGLLNDLPQRFTASDRLITLNASSITQLVLDGLRKDQNFLDLVESKTITIASRDSTDGIRAIMSSGDISSVRQCA